MMTESTSKQEKATAASYRVAWILGRKKKPFMDSEIVRVYDGSYRRNSD